MSKQVLNWTGQFKTERMGHFARNLHLKAQCVLFFLVYIFGGVYAQTGSWAYDYSFFDQMSFFTSSQYSFSADREHQQMIYQSV